jgi:hypothetical protein
MILGSPLRFLAGLVCIALPAGSLRAQTQTQSPPSSSSSSAKRVKTPAAPRDSGLDAGTVTNGVYRNKSLALSCEIPPGWVLRTDEMNAPEEKRQEDEKQEKDDTASAKPPATPASSAGARVLLAAFSRPPEAKGEDVNASILIAAENASSYPGLKDPAQYFGPLTEVAKAQGFTVDEEPYELAVGAKTLVRGDFHKDVGARVLRQSTLTMLAHGYAVSITVIGGTEDEVEGLIDGLTFTPSGK